MTDPTPRHSADSAPQDTDAHLDRIWKRAYAAKSRNDLLKLYADWADTYDEDHASIAFFGHVTAGRKLAEYTPFSEVAPVLDAGAGTGAAGEVLAGLGYRNLTAVDMSPDMLAKAADKGIYNNLVEADLGKPLDVFPADLFHACILVGVFSYGQAPAHALDEIVRVVQPGGVVVFTMRTDFHEEDAMGVRSRMEALEKAGAWRRIEVTKPQPYLPRKDPDARFRVWCYRVLATKRPAETGTLGDAVRRALSSKGPVKRIDHCHIWNSMASRLYNAYIESPDYYLVNCEEEIIRSHAPEISGEEQVLVELGCGSERKIRHLLEAVITSHPRKPPVYVPIDLSAGALASTRRALTRRFGDRLEIDVRQGHFDRVLPGLAKGESKALFFFGSSLGNIETIEDTVRFLSRIRSLLGDGERLVVGLDLDKDDRILKRAYEAGPANRSFFLNMIRRINYELGGNFELEAFEQESTCDREAPYRGISTRCVNLKLVSRIPQQIYLSRLDLETHLEAGDAIQVGTSRKFGAETIGPLGALAGLKLTRQWFDSRRYFSLNEFVREEIVN